MRYLTGWSLRNIKTGELSGFYPESPAEWDGGEVPVPVVMVEIPEPVGGCCDPRCAFNYMGTEKEGCTRRWMRDLSPGPDCPAGKVKP